MLEAGEVRKRLRQTIEAAKRDAATRRAALADVQKAFQDLASKYGAKPSEEGEAYRVSLLCYPNHHRRTE